ncbi:MAG: cupin domain-containing protein [Candidatus Zixiibacteriota bacterium]
MPVIKYSELKATKVEMDGVKGVTKKIPVGKNEGWENMTMRTFTLQPGGYAPKHAHEWEHVNYVIKGKGQLMIDGKEYILEEKDFAFVPPNAHHQFSNPFDEEFEFICIVPNRGEY